MKLQEPLAVRIQTPLSIAATLQARKIGSCLSIPKTIGKPSENHTFHGFFLVNALESLESPEFPAVSVRSHSPQMGSPKMGSPKMGPGWPEEGDFIPCEAKD